MPAGLPALVVADAGFCGYATCRRILQADHSFLLRVGSNVTLLTDLGDCVEQRDGLVFLWPENFHNQPPLVLRWITLHRGRQTVHLLTNVLDPRELSDEDASVLYDRRWGIGVGHRSYKQTLDRRTLLSRTPATCLLEARWTMLGLWLLGLLCVSRQLPSTSLAAGRRPRPAARCVVRFASRRIAQIAAAESAWTPHCGAPDSTPRPLMHPNSPSGAARVAPLRANLILTKFDFRSFGGQQERVCRKEASLAGTLREASPTLVPQGGSPWILYAPFVICCNRSAP